jgi:hypothetical protein
MKVNPAFVFILIIATSLTIHTPIHLYLAIISALGVLNLGSYHGPHTFSKVSSPVVIRRFELGSFHRRLHPPSAGMHQSGSKKLSTTMWTMGEITTTDYIERESCGTLLAILHLDFYVWSFCAFLLDSSIYTNSLWCLRLSS